VTGLRHLLEPSTGFTAIQYAELQQALGFALLGIGEQAGDKNALADAAKAFGATLAVWTREQEPRRWAATISEPRSRPEPLDESGEAARHWRAAGPL
jgi:hypothetical protein